jgi:hypothetical protein
MRDVVSNKKKLGSWPGQGMGTPLRNRCSETRPVRTIHVGKVSAVERKDAVKVVTEPASNRHVTRNQG